MGRIRRALGVQKPKNKDPAVIHALRTSIDHPDPATRRDSLDPEMMAAILASTQEAQPPQPAPPQPTANVHQASPHLSRAFSQANPQLAKEVREHRSEMLRQTPTGIHFFDNEVTESSALVLPSFEGSMQLRNMVVGQLENAYVQREAEKEGIINRPAIRPFTSHQIVLNTAGDGNCLSHACSLGIWGVHDHDRLLRRALLGTFQSPKAGAQLRQRFECQLADQGMPADSWAGEWQKEVEALENTQGFSDKFLADIHCFTLANVLRHPIIIYGDKMAAMSGLAGIYLPLLWDDPAGVCSRQPVTVLYHSNHFSLLAVVEGEGPTTPPLIPLSTSDALLPVRFLLPHEQPRDGSFPSESIGRFLDIQPMREGGWGIRLQADPAPNALFSLLEGAFIQEMAASGGVPAVDIPCSWSRDSPSCSYRPKSISVPPVATHMGQPAPHPGSNPGPNPLRPPSPRQQELPMARNMQDQDTKLLLQQAPTLLVS
ncbi:hypothetical protein WJX84_008928 [Apatococcus fuscideae]|uniref:OTU domain-containing protein n=1 Tax=Apatococcus fuscideae TaxID=2026836 RepID=A0AAW1T480_9CHLO